MSDTTKKAVFTNLGPIGGNFKSLKPSAIDHSDISSKPMQAKQLGQPQNNRFLNQTALLNNRANGTLNKSATSFDVSPYTNSPYVNSLGFNKNVYRGTPVPSGDVSTKSAEFFDELSAKVMNSGSDLFAKGKGLLSSLTSKDTTPGSTAAPAPAPASVPAPSPAPEPKAPAAEPVAPKPAPPAPSPIVGNTGSQYDTFKGYDQRVGAHAPTPLPAPAKTFAQEALAPGADIPSLVNKYYVDPQVSKTNYEQPNQAAMAMFKNFYKEKYPNRPDVDPVKFINEAGAIFDPDHPQYNKIREPYYNKKPMEPLRPGHNYTMPQSSKLNEATLGGALPLGGTGGAVGADQVRRRINPELVDYLHGAGLIQKGRLADKDFTSGFGQSRGITGPEDTTSDSPAFQAGSQVYKLQRLRSIAEELQTMPEDMRTKAIEHMPLALHKGIYQADNRLGPSIEQSFSGLVNKTIGELGTINTPSGSNQSVFDLLSDPRSTISIADRIKTLPLDKQALVNNLPAHQFNLIRDIADKHGNQSLIEKAKAISGGDNKVKGLTSGEQRHVPGYWFDGKLGELEEKYGVGAVQPTKGVGDTLRAFYPFKTDKVYNDVHAQVINEKNNLSIDRSKEVKALLNTLERIQNPNDSYSAGLTPEQKLDKINQIRGELSTNIELAKMNDRYISQLNSISANPTQESLRKGHMGSVALDVAGNALNLHPGLNFFNTLAGMGVHGNEGNGFVTHENKETLANSLGFLASLGPNVANVFKAKGVWPKINQSLLPAATLIDPINEVVKYRAAANAEPNNLEHIEAQLRGAKTPEQIRQILAKAEKADQDALNKANAPAVQEVKKPGVTSGMTSLQKALLAAGIGIPTVMAITAALGSRKATNADDDDDEEDDNEDEASYKRKLRARNAHR